MDRLNLFVPLSKVDLEQRIVYGVATAESEDLSGEVCDYASTKPNYQAWSEKFSQATGGRSLGNVRAMHGKIAAGKVTGIDFNDDAKQITIAAKIVDDAEWAKVVEGVYTGFSQGGRYVKRWADGKLMRYTADPHEVSLVDLPCLPTATFQVVKAEGAEDRHFATTIKPPADPAIMDRAEALAKDAGGEPADFVKPATEQLNTEALRAVAKARLAELPEIEDDDPAEPDDVGKAATAVEKQFEPTPKWDCGCADHNHVKKAHAVACMKSRAVAEKKADPLGAALSDLEAKVGLEKAAEADPLAAAVEALFPAITKRAKPEAPAELTDPAEIEKAAAAALAKGLDDVASFAGVLQTMRWLYRYALSERTYEGDASTVPDDLAALLRSAGEILVRWAAEEVAEMMPTATDAAESMYMGAGLTPEREEALKALAAAGPQFAVLAKFEAQDEPIERLFEKKGARNSKGDLGRIQGIHDHSCSLGAKCDEGNCGKDAATGDNLSKALTELDDLKKEREGTITRLRQIGEQMDAYKAETDAKIAKLEAQPMPAKARIAAVAVEKGGIGAGGQAADVDEFKKHFSSLTEGERSKVLLDLALANPITLR